MTVNRAGNSAGWLMTRSLQSRWEERYPKNHAKGQARRGVAPLAEHGKVQETTRARRPRRNTLGARGSRRTVGFTEGEGC